MVPGLPDSSKPSCPKLDLQIVFDGDRVARRSTQHERNDIAVRAKQNGYEPYIPRPIVIEHLLSQKSFPVGATELGPFKTSLVALGAHHKDVVRLGKLAFHPS